MKQRLEPVHVGADAQGVPQRLYWRGRLYRVIGVEDQWRYAGKWWLDGRGWRRAYFRVTARAVGRDSTPRRNSTSSPDNEVTLGGEVTLEVFRQGANWVLSHECD